MSAISGVGLDPQAMLTQELQRLRAGQNSTDRAAQRKAELESALKAAGADPAKLPELEQQIQDAAQKASQSTEASTDPRTAIQDAVNKVLSDNGLDPAKFDAQMKAQHAGGHRHHPHGGGAQAGSAASATPADLLQRQSPTASESASDPADGTTVNLMA